MKIDYKANTNYFKKENVNPKNKKAADCVARAISKATGISWEQVIRELTEYGIEKGLVFNEKATYGSWLVENGWMMQKQPRKSDNTKYTVKEFTSLYSQGIYIIGVANHLTVVIDGYIYDTWNCGSKTVGNYWIKQNNF